MEASLRGDLRWDTIPALLAARAAESGDQAAIVDMFVVGGFNVSPAEVEKSLLEHPDVDQAAVIGVPDDRLGEVGMAFVTARAGSELSAAGLLEWCRPRLASFKVPRFVEVVDELPRNATGKVLKEELRRRSSGPGTGRGSGGSGGSGSPGSSPG